MKAVFRFLFKTGSFIFKPLRKKGLYQSKFLVGLFKFICRFFLSDSKYRNLVMTKVGPNKMYINYKDRLSSVPLIFWGEWEEFELDLFTKYIEPGMNIIDIGASNGYYTLAAAHETGEKGKIFAFEPDPDSYDLILKNVKLNNFKNCIVEQKAVSDNKGEIKLFYSENRDLNSIIYPGNEENYFIVESVKLDEYMEKYKYEVDIIKMDIEGAEMHAFMGMEKILQKNKNIKIFTEFCPFAINRSKYTAKQFLNFFLEMKFKIYEVNDKEKKISEVSVDSLMERYGSEEMIEAEAHTNLIIYR